MVHAGNLTRDREPKTSSAMFASSVVVQAHESI
jgi:hypothetical protein